MTSEREREREPPKHPYLEEEGDREIPTPSHPYLNGRRRQRGCLCGGLSLSAVPIETGLVLSKPGSIGTVPLEAIPIEAGFALSKPVSIGTARLEAVPIKAGLALVDSLCWLIRFAFIRCASLRFSKTPTVCVAWAFA